MIPLARPLEYKPFIVTALIMVLAALGLYFAPTSWIWWPAYGAEVFSILKMLELINERLSVHTRRRAIFGLGVLSGIGVWYLNAAAPWLWWSSMVTFCLSMANWLDQLDRIYPDTKEYFFVNKAILAKIKVGALGAVGICFGILPVIAWPCLGIAVLSTIASKPIQQRVSLVLEDDAVTREREAEEQQWCALSFTWDTSLENRQATRVVDILIQYFKESPLLQKNVCDAMVNQLQLVYQPALKTAEWKNIFTKDMLQHFDKWHPILFPDFIPALLAKPKRPFVMPKPKDMQLTIEMVQEIFRVFSMPPLSEHDIISLQPPTPLVMLSPPFFAATAEGTQPQTRAEIAAKRDAYFTKLLA